MKKLTDIFRRTEVWVALISGILASTVTLVTTLKSIIPEISIGVEWRMKKWPLAIACPVEGSGRTIVFILSSVTTDQNYMIYSNSFMTRHRQLNHLGLSEDSSNALENWTLELYYSATSGEYISNPEPWSDSENEARNALIASNGLGNVCAKGRTSLRDLKEHWVGVKTSRPFKNLHAESEAE